MKYLLYQFSQMTKAIRKFLNTQSELIKFLREIESYKKLQAKYREQVIIVYHARCELGADGWLRVLKRIKEKPTLDHIMGEFDGDKNV